MKILLVEDSSTVRYAMCNCIRSAGHEPILAENGEAALQIIDRTPVDMVIMDVELPGLDGFEATRLIRESQDAWMPIIFVTGKSEEQDLRRGIDVGGDDYLIKPVSEAILLAKIRAMQRITEMRDELTRLNLELTVLSERDSLTKLYNRRTFEQRAAEQWRLAARSKEPLAVLIIDIDQFKAYNDCYGHLAGDECIKRVAETIQQSLSRPSDLLARYGGEEFIVLLPDTQEEGALHVAERIRANVAALDIKHRASPPENRITVSIGGAVVAYTAGTRMLDQVNAADQALYASKTAGRNRVTIKPFSPKTLVLVAELDNVLTSLLEGRLTTECALLQAHTIDETAELAMCNRPDVVIIDEALAGGQGFSAALAVRENSITSHIPIIFIGSGQEPDACNALRPFSYWLGKPLNRRQLVRQVEALLLAH